MSSIRDFQNYADGVIDEEALAESSVTDADIEEFVSDQEFMSECVRLATPIIVQTMMSDNIMAALDEDVEEATNIILGYLEGQGIISEAAVPHIDKRLNVVHLSKEAQIRRLTSIITLKMARHKNHRAFKKYKIAQRLKKENMATMKKIYGKKASLLAKKVWLSTHGSGKVAAAVSSTPTGKKNLEFPPQSQTKKNEKQRKAA